jgi:hypothetical protein
MADFRVGLAPDRLSQVINPWSWTMGNFNLFTVNLGQSSDPEFEAKVLDRVGSYGRQIGRIGEALAVVLAHMDRDSLQPQELAALRALERQLEEIADMKAQERAGAVPAIRP